MTTSSTSPTGSAPVAIRNIGACPPWCDGHAEDFQPWWYGDAGERERDHATYFESVGDGSDRVTVGLVAVQTATGIGPGRIVIDPEGAHDAVEQRLTPGQATAVASALAGEGRAPDVAGQLRAAAALARSWLN